MTVANGCDHDDARIRARRRRFSSLSSAHRSERRTNPSPPPIHFLSSAPNFETSNRNSPHHPIEKRIGKGDHSMKTSWSSSSKSTAASSSSSYLPPPPTVAASTHLHYQSHRSSSGGSSSGHMGINNNSSSYAQALVTSLTIDEMRELHRRAQRDADAKRTELRLVLASRYRELVGSSDQVLKMKERSYELHELLKGVPTLLEKLEASMNEQSTIQQQCVDHLQQHQKERETAHDEEEEKSRSLRDGDIHGTRAGSSHAASSSFPTSTTNSIRGRLAVLPRLLFRHLDSHNVHAATVLLLEIMALIATQTSEYPLANALSQTRQRLVDAKAVPPLMETVGGATANDDEETAAQVRMVYFMVQALPKKICEMATGILEGGPNTNRTALQYGAEVAASCLSAMDLLTVGSNSDDGTTATATSLVDTYYQCKSKRLLQLVDRLSSAAAAGKSTSSTGPDEVKDGESAAGTSAAAPSALSTVEAESILSQIVLLLQYECILYPYQVFAKRQFASLHNPDHNVMMCLPMFDPAYIQARCSKFLATHLPLVRSKAKSILGIIAGTTASALGQIRQSLYDKTDGVECIDALNRNGGGMPGSWLEAVHWMVERRLVAEYGSGNDASGSSGVSGLGRSSGSDALLVTTSHERRFSLWNALFSGTFSSLVHSILTSAFASVHTSVVSTLQSSLRNAPDWSSILPHEAHRNTLCMATGLNEALVKLSDDAHELLVHAEERIESERRLRQSLYVQTCEILGRLLCELRGMVMTRPGGGGHGPHGPVSSTNKNKSSDEADAIATRDLIVGRLCVLHKFRLSSLSKLLDPSASPAAMQSASGMITHVDLQSAFDLADDDEDGLVGFDEALEAMEAAFSGTSWRGAQLVRETLLVTDDRSHASHAPAVANVTLNELTLLGARGLRHDATGPKSALGVFQASLDDIVNRCFERWAGTALSPSSALFESTLSDFMATASTVDDAEWLRLYGTGLAASPGSTSAADDSVRGVSPHVLCLLLDASSIFNRITCPADFLPPVPSIEYANSLGTTCTSLGTIATLSDRLRLALMHQTVTAMTSSFARHCKSSQVSSLDKMKGVALSQLYLDVAFVARLDVQGTSTPSGSESPSTVDTHSKTLTDVKTQVEQAFQARRAFSSDQVKTLLSESQAQAMELCSLYLSSLVGESLLSSLSSSGVEFDSRSGSSAPMLRAPLRSTTRFVLLPVQADRTSADVQLRNRYNKPKDSSSSSRPDASSGGVMSSGLGFLSSMLKKG